MQILNAMPLFISSHSGTAGHAEQILMALSLDRKLAPCLDVALSLSYCTPVMRPDLFMT